MTGGSGQESFGATVWLYGREEGRKAENIRGCGFVSDADMKRGRRCGMFKEHRSVGSMYVGDEAYAGEMSPRTPVSTQGCFAYPLQAFKCQESRPVCELVQLPTHSFVPLDALCSCLLSLPSVLHYRAQMPVIFPPQQQRRGPARAHRSARARRHRDEQRRVPSTSRRVAHCT